MQNSSQNFFFSFQSNKNYNQIKRYLTGEDDDPIRVDFFKEVVDEVVLGDEALEDVDVDAAQQRAPGARSVVHDVQLGEEQSPVCARAGSTSSGRPIQDTFNTNRIHWGPGTNQLMRCARKSVQDFGVHRRRALNRFPSPEAGHGRTEGQCGCSCRNTTRERHIARVGCPSTDTRGFLVY